jgi:hypothetical protein
MRVVACGGRLTSRHCSDASRQSRARQISINFEDLDFLAATGMLSLRRQALQRIPDLEPVQGSGAFATSAAYVATFDSAAHPQVDRRGDTRH